MFPLYLATALIFLLLDAVVLKLVMQPLFQRHLGDTMRDGVFAAPAAVFYLFYIAGLVWLVSMPALLTGNHLSAGLRGAVVGAMAYGTYEFTSMSVMRDWSWQMVAADTIWGTFLTGFSAWAGVWVVLRFA
jgi:uncharacterized membrane protein